jgi:hypothetical protein
MCARGARAAACAASARFIAPVSSQLTRPAACLLAPAPARRQSAAPCEIAFCAVGDAPALFAAIDDL